MQGECETRSRLTFVYSILVSPPFLKIAFLLQGTIMHGIERVIQLMLIIPSVAFSLSRRGILGIRDISYFL